MSDDFPYPPLVVVQDHTKVIDRTTPPSDNLAPATQAPTVAGGKVDVEHHHDVPMYFGKRKRAVRGLQSTGEGAPGSDGTVPAVTETHGFKASSGAQVAITGGPHNESIEIVHSKGTRITIGPDGEIAIVAGPSVGISSQTGDASLTGKTSVVVKGADVTVEATGALSLKSLSSSVTIEAEGDIKLDAGGSIMLGADGRLVTQSGYDTSITAVDAFAVTSGGNATIQTDGHFQADATDYGKIIAGESVELHGKSFKINSDSGASEMTTKGLLSIKSTDDMSIEGKSIHNKAGDVMSIEGTNFTELRAPFINLQSRGGAINLDSNEAIVASGKSVRMSATEDFFVFSADSTMHATGNTKIQANGNMDLRGAPIDLNKASPAAESPTPAQPTGPDGPSEAPAPEKPKAADSKTIAKAIRVSRYEAPSYDGNAYKKTKSTISADQGEGTTVPEEAKKIAEETPSPEVASGEVAESQETVQEQPATEVDKDNRVPIEGIADNGKMGTLGDPDFPGSRKIPGDGQAGFSAEEIKDNIATWKFNILEKVRKQFPEAGARVGPRGFVLLPAGSTGEESGHFTGLAADIRFGNDLDNRQVAEIADWIYKNLSVERVMLERFAEGTYFVHVEIPYTPPGDTNTGSGGILTQKADGSYVDGIDYNLIDGSVPTEESTGDQ